MARKAGLIRWFNKTDVTVYFRGKKVFRTSDMKALEMFEEAFINGYAKSGVEAAALVKKSPVHPVEAKLTATSISLFKDYAEDAVNWSGTPLVGGNVGGSKEERGNLTQLKKADLIYTDHSKEEGCTWLYFTDLGVEFAAHLGITIYRY